MNFSSNISMIPEESNSNDMKDMRGLISEEHSLLVTAVCGFIAVFSFIGNLLLCIVIVIRRSMLSKPYNVLIFNLAITDMLTGIFIAVTPSYVLGQAYYHLDDNIAGELFCRLIGSTYFLFVFGKGSTLTIMCLAIERWFSVVKPLKYKYAFKRGRLQLHIAIIWAFSCFTQINELFIMKTSHGICVRSSPPYSVKTEKILTLIHILATFFVPSIVTWVTFAHVWLHVRSNTVHHRKRSSNYERAKQKLIHMCAVTALLLTVCWFPAEIFFLLKEFNVVSLSFRFYQFTDMLAMSNSCFNPWVYFLYNREYRRAFLSLVTVKIRKQDNRKTTFNLLYAAKSPSVVLIRQVKMQPERGSREINVHR